MYLSWRGPLRPQQHLELVVWLLEKTAGENTVFLASDTTPIRQTTGQPVFQLKLRQQDLHHRIMFQILCEGGVK